MPWDRVTDDGDLAEKDGRAKLCGSRDRHQKMIPYSRFMGRKKVGGGGITSLKLHNVEHITEKANNNKNDRYQDSYPGK